MDEPDERTERIRAEADIFKSIVREFEARIGEHRELCPDADVRDVFRSIIARFATRAPEELDHLSTDLSHLFRSATRKRMFIYPTVKPALGQMQKKYRLGIVSNAQEAFTMPELGLYELARYFETIVLSSQAGVKKPNSRIFTRALGNLGVKPSEAVMVGNDMGADMMGASTYDGIFIAAEAVEKAGNTDKTAVRQALIDLEMPQVIEAMKNQTCSFSPDYRESSFDLWMEQLAFNATLGETRPSIVWPDNLKTTEFVLPAWYVPGSA